MRNAMRITVSVFGVLAALAGLEHGIGEALQGNVAPEGMMILSWAGSEWFRILGGEPAMTVVPNLLVTGILTILVSLAFLVWATLFVHRKNGGLVLILLSMLLLVVGGGFGPPLLGTIVGVAATRIRASRTQGGQPVSGAGRWLAVSWPWFLGGGLGAGLMLLPGSILVDHFVGVSDPELFVPVVLACAMGFLLLTIAAGLARDRAAER
jgi:hypothetical protein